MLRFIRSSTLITALSLCSGALAKPAFYEVISAKYHFAADSPAAKAKCRICHTRPPQRNEYGALVDQQLGDKETITPSMLEAIEGKTGTGQTQTYGELLKAGQLPTTASATDNGSKAPTPIPPQTLEAPQQEPLFPLHSFHPAVVHFPIALVLFAAFLRLVAGQAKSDFYEKCANLNMAAGVVSLLVVIPTGIMAWLRNGFSFSGDLRNHFIVAVASSIVAVISLSTNKSKPKLGFALLLLAAVGFGLAGHLGSKMIYP